MVGLHHGTWPIEDESYGLSAVVYPAIVQIENNASVSAVTGVMPMCDNIDMVELCEE